LVEACRRHRGLARVTEVRRQRNLGGALDPIGHEPMAVLQLVEAVVGIVRPLRVFEYHLIGALILGLPGNYGAEADASSQLAVLFLLGCRRARIVEAGRLLPLVPVDRPEADWYAPPAP